MRQHLAGVVYGNDCGNSNGKRTWRVALRNNECVRLPKIIHMSRFPGGAHEHEGNLLY